MKNRTTSKSGSKEGNPAKRPIKNFVFSIGAITLATGLSVPASAQDMSYSFIEATYLDTEIDDNNFDVDGDGFGVSGAIELNETLFLQAGYASQDFDFSIDLDQFNVGIGAHLPLAENVDLVGAVNYIDAEVDTRFGDIDDDGYGLDLGVRARLAEQFEVEGGINYVDLDDSGDETSLQLGGRYYLSQELAFGAGVQIGDDVTTWQLGVRLEF